MYISIHCTELTRYATNPFKGVKQIKEILCSKLLCQYGLVIKNQVLGLDVSEYEFQFCHLLAV